MKSGWILSAGGDRLLPTGGGRGRRRRATGLLFAAGLCVLGLTACGGGSSGGSADSGGTRGAADGSSAAGPGPTSPTAPPSSTHPVNASGAAAAKLPPPCSLISAGEVSASLGYPVSSMDSSADNDPDQISCLYMRGSKPCMVVLERQWTLEHFTADAAKEPSKPQPVSGVATSAYLGSNEKGPLVFLWERGVALIVNGAMTADQAKFLAKVAVGQLDSPH